MHAHLVPSTAKRLALGLKPGTVQAFWVLCVPKQGRHRAASERESTSGLLATRIRLVTDLPLGRFDARSSRHLLSPLLAHAHFATGNG
jgi:hypothetical protein